jgi:hypothetical protein
MSCNQQIFTLKSVHMISFTMYKFNLNIAILLIAICMLLLFNGCHQPPQSNCQACRPTAPTSVSDSPCIDVEGKVLGGIKSNSLVYLYQTTSLNFSIVMAEIRNGQATMQECVNATKAFKFNCLYPGKYAFVIPTTSYNGSAGAPLPYEFDCENVSIRIAFQGGDSKYKVGAFSIIQPPIENKTGYKKNPLSCLKNRGSLYIECPHYQG